MKLVILENVLSNKDDENRFFIKTRKNGGVQHGLSLDLKSRIKVTELAAEDLMEMDLASVCVKVCEVEVKMPSVKDLELLSKEMREA